MNKIKFLNRKVAIISVLVMMLVMVTSVAHAITIVVDGVRETVWDTGVNGIVPGRIGDLNEGGISDDHDIEEFLWTNDPTKMYFLMQTYADTGWGGNPRPTLIICLDIDNNATTGGAYANCDNMTGIDRSIVVERQGVGLSVTVLNGDPVADDVIATGVGVRQTNVNEISVNLADLGISSAQCIQGMPAAIYFDGGSTDPDDNTPDAGTFTIGCGDPTAVNLGTFSAGNSTNTLPIMAASVLAVLALIGAGVFIVRREQEQA